MGSIDYDDVTTMVGICIKCGACEKKCPTGAIFYDDPNYIKHRGELEEDYPMRKENLTLLSYSIYHMEQGFATDPQPTSSCPQLLHTYRDLFTILIPLG